MDGTREAISGNAGFIEHHVGVERVPRSITAATVTSTQTHVGSKTYSYTIKLRGTLIVVTISPLPLLFPSSPLSHTSTCPLLTLSSPPVSPSSSLSSLNPSSKCRLSPSPSSSGNRTWPSPEKWSEIVRCRLCSGTRLCFTKMGRSAIR